MKQSPVSKSGTNRCKPARFVPFRLYESKKRAKRWEKPEILKIY